MAGLETVNNGDLVFDVDAEAMGFRRVHENIVNDRFLDGLDVLLHDFFQCPVDDCWVFVLLIDLSQNVFNSFRFQLSDIFVVDHREKPQIRFVVLHPDLYQRFVSWAFRLLHDYLVFFVFANTVSFLLRLCHPAFQGFAVDLDISDSVWAYI